MGASMVSEVFKICNAYESGYGDGQQGEEGKNAYPEGSKEHEAYQIGYDAGLASEADRQVFRV